MNKGSWMGWYVLLAAALLPAGCESKSTGQKEPGQKQAMQAEKEQTEPAREQPARPAPEPEPAAATGEELQRIGASVNRFGFDLYRQLAGRAESPCKNLFFSPLSVSSALGMTWAGARGGTAEQMKSTLHFPMSGDDLHHAMGALVQALDRPGKQGAFELSVANALWGQTGFKIQKPFLDICRGAYGAVFEQLDFKKEPEGSRRKINEWVAERTGKRITELVPKRAINDLTRLILTNAVYFKADWTSPFKKRATRKRPFHLAGGEEIEVDTMMQRGRFGYARLDGSQLLTMPYKGGRIRMIIVLPEKVDGLGEIEKEMDEASLAEALGKVEPQEVDVFLPRFEFSSSSRLKEHLAGMGMQLAFTRNQADFSGINGIEPPDVNVLYISDVFHKAFVAVDEKGTEAAAATAVVQVVGGAGLLQNLQKPPPVFKADHPFLFLIQDIQSDAVLYMGRLVDPTQGG